MSHPQLIIFTARKLSFYMCVSVHRGWHAWWGHEWWGACMAREGGMHGRGGGVHGGGCVWQILRDTVNERTVRILLECILVTDISTLKYCVICENLKVCTSAFTSKRSAGQKKL